MQPWTQVRGWDRGSQEQDLQTQGRSSWDRDSRIQRTRGDKFLLFLP